MALAGPLAGARLIALDTSAFIYLIERHPTFFEAEDGGSCASRDAPQTGHLEVFPLVHATALARAT